MSVPACARAASPHARPGGHAPLPQTPFVLGSTTKSFTALAVMQLVKAGKIELDAPVQCYLPWFRVADPLASAQMTVRHLLNQTSGLPMLHKPVPPAKLRSIVFHLLIAPQPQH